MTPKCVIAGAGEWFGAPEVSAGDLVIAADGGYASLVRAGLRVDVLIGDMDSLSRVPGHVEVIRLPVKKDDTDMLAAIRLGLARGYTRFHLYGGTGGRLDHTLANLQCLAFLAQQDAMGFLYARDCITTCIRNSSIHFSGGHMGILSVFAFSDVASGVHLKGLKYELDDAELRNTFPVGVSNEFTRDAATVSVGEGTLLVSYPYMIHLQEEP